MQDALREWEDKLAFLLREEAKVSDPSAKFNIRRDIDEAKARIDDIKQRLATPQRISSSPGPRSSGSVDHLSSNSTASLHSGHSDNNDADDEHRTRLQKQLATLLADAQLKTDPAYGALASAWGLPGHWQVLGKLSDFLDDLERNDAFALIAQIRSSANRAGISSSNRRNAVAPHTIRLLGVMLLVAVERIVHQRKSGALHPVDVDEKFPLDDTIQAAMAGACWLDCGLLLLANGDSAAARPLNIITDMPISEFGYKTPIQCAEAELDAALRIGENLDAPGSRSDHLRRIKGEGKPRSGATLRGALDECWHRHGARFAMAIHNDSEPIALVDPALRAELSQKYGVESFIYGRSPVAASEASEQQWEDLIEALRTCSLLIADWVSGATSVRAVNSFSQASPVRNRVFVSYAHDDEDNDTFKYFWKQIGALVAQGHIDLWTDKRIGAGEDWQAEIDQAMASASVAVFLVSASFLKSNFIRAKEVPTLLQRHRDDGMKLMPILMIDCVWDSEPWIQAMELTPGSTAIDSLDAKQVNPALAEIVRKIRRMLPHSSSD